MPHLTDPNFNRTVVLMCDHNEDGAMGLVINRTYPISLSEVFAGQELTGLGGSESPVHYGGPVQPDAGFLLYTNGKDYPSSKAVTGDIRLGTTMDILEDISEDDGPGRYFFALGYAGWGSGQLEEEIRNNDWLVVPCCANLLFHSPADEKWEAAIKKLGISPDMLGTPSGTPTGNA